MCCAHWLLAKCATVNSEHYTKTLKKFSRNTSRERGQKLMKSCFKNTMPSITRIPPQLMPLHICDLQCYHIQSTVQILLLAISTCCPNWRKNSGAKTSLLIRKSKLQYANGFRRNKKAFFTHEIRNLVKRWHRITEVGEHNVEKWLRTVVNKG